MNKNDIELAIRDYHWIPKEIERLEKTLGIIEVPVTAAYGIEATLPKPKGLNGDKVGKSVVRKSLREEKQSKVLKKLRYKIELIDSQIDRIIEDREKAVLLCLLDGMSQTQISLHLRLSEGKVSKIKTNIIEEIFNNLQNELSVRNEGNEVNKETEHIELNKEKCI